MKAKLRNPKLIAALIIILLCVIGLISTDFLLYMLVAIAISCVLFVIWISLVEIIKYFLDKENR